MNQILSPCKQGYKNTKPYSRNKLTWGDQNDRISSSLSLVGMQWKKRERQDKRNNVMDELGYYYIFGGFGYEKI